MVYMYTNKINQLKKRILEISYQEKLSHLSSCLNSVDTIYKIYQQKNDQDIFILSNGHAGLAYYVVLEDYYTKIDAVDLLHKHGIHPSRDLRNDIHVSTGSLGIGLTIAVGYALASRDTNVYCMISDGECAEGSIWEALRLAQTCNLTNLHVYCIVNGQSAYSYIDSKYLIDRLKVFYPRINIVMRDTYLSDNVDGLLSHYHAIKSEQELNDLIERHCNA